MCCRCPRGQAQVGRREKIRVMGKIPMRIYRVLKVLNLMKRISAAVDCGDLVRGVIFFPGREAARGRIQTLGGKKAYMTRVGHRKAPVLLNAQRETCPSMVT